MTMTYAEQAASIALAVLGVALTRALPFLVFSPKRPVPQVVRYLGRCLAPAVFGLLVVYCFRGPLTGGPHGGAMFAASVATAIIQALLRRMMLSILLGTGFYIALLMLQ